MVSESKFPKVRILSTAEIMAPMSPKENAVAAIAEKVHDETGNWPDPRKDEIRVALVAELTAVNGSPEHSADMVRRIESGELALPKIHSDKAHALAKALVS